MRSSFASLIKFVAIVLATGSTVVACAKANVTPEPEPEKPEKPDVVLPEKVIPKFIHATYIVGDRLTSPTEIAQSNYAKFHFIYLMAAPAVVASDFDKVDSDIIKKYVTDYLYPTTASGRGLVPSLIKQARSMGSKVLLSVAGNEDLVPIIKSPTKRAKFAHMIANFVDKFNYDGVELDWEGGFEIDLHASMMNDIRIELDKIEQKQVSRLYLTTALGTWRKYNFDQAKRLSGIVDWVNLMTYDFGGGNWGNKPSHNTPLNGIKQAIAQNFSNFAPNKICIGLANYGYQYFGLKPDVAVEAGMLEKHGRSIGYHEIPRCLAQGWTEQWDEAASAPYYFSPDKKDFASHDNIRSLDAKLDWIIGQKFLGEFWWVFNCDYVEPKAGEKYATNVLIDHVEEQYKKLVK
ncbi:MAG: glycoside hydrolase family 18 protein [Mucinivorans sp.]